MPGNPLNDPNWAASLADTIVRVVGSVRDKTTKPVLTIVRGAIFGLVAVFGGGVALTLLVIGGLRALQDLIDLFAPRRDAVWICYLGLGIIFSVVGLVLLKKRFPVPEETTT